MALMLAGRAMRTVRLSLTVKLVMAVAWVVVIIAATLTASWWQQH